jgi:hypothetical protein
MLTSFLTPRVAPEDTATRHLPALPLNPTGEPNDINGITTRGVHEYEVAHQEIEEEDIPVSHLLVRHSIQKVFTLSDRQAIVRILYLNDLQNLIQLVEPHHHQKHELCGPCESHNRLDSAVQ